MDLETPPISNLARHPELTDTIAQWHWREWGHTDPEDSLRAWTESRRSRSGRAGVPPNYVALRSVLPVGRSSLVGRDMDTRTGLEPWLAGVLVLPEHRGHGVGPALVQRASLQAARVAVPTLNL